MTSPGFGDESLTAKRRRAAFRAAAFFLVGVGATLFAIGAALQPFPLPAAEWGLAALEICALIGFFRFGWWFSHLRAIEERMAGAGARPVAEESVFW